MAKTNRVCCMCKKKYYYCSGGCTADIDKPSWMINFCGDNCFGIYATLTNYKEGRLTKEEAKLKLSGYDMSEQDKYSEMMKKIIKDIMDEKDECIEKKIEDVEDVENFEDVKEEVVFDNADIVDVVETVANEEIADNIVPTASTIAETEDKEIEEEIPTTNVFTSKSRKKRRKEI